jgi:hypothetical protein
MHDLLLLSAFIAMILVPCLIGRGRDAEQD